jgi:energy-coupling factor transporter ATP-binding protein EcfA2
LGIEEVAIVPTVDIEKLLEAVNLKFAIEDEVSLPIENLGQGHISKATLKLAELLAGDCVICVEEPEIHVHPTGIKSLVKTFEELTASGKQVIITTHSPEIVNNSRYDSLLVVQKAIHRTSVDRIDPTQVGFSAEDAEEFQNIILRKRQRGDLFLSKYILLVEGEYDRLVLEALDRNGTLGLLEKDVTIVDMGGHGEFAKYHRILHRLNKPYVVLFDTAAISEVHQNATSKEGVGITTLKGDGTIGATHWTATNHTDFVRQTARARRGHIARLNQRIRSTDIGIVVHGHRDMTGIVKECWQKASVPEKLQLYKSLGGQNPNPTDREISNALNNAVDSKDMKMVQVVAGINPTAFGVLTDRINTALSRMFAE